MPRAIISLRIANEEDSTSRRPVKTTRLEQLTNYGHAAPTSKEWVPKHGKPELWNFFGTRGNIHTRSQVTPFGQQHVPNQKTSEKAFPGPELHCLGLTPFCVRHVHKSA